jgi:DNA-binding MarR family transcriptional regulator
MLDAMRRVAGTADGELAARLRVVAVRLFRLLRIRAAHQLTPSQVSVLARIGQCGPIRLGALAEAEALNPATLTRMIDALAGMGLVDRRPDPDDRRAVLVATSPEGVKLIAQVRESGNAVLRVALAELRAEDRASIAAALPALEELVQRLHVAEPPSRAPVPPAGQLT